MSSIPRSCSIRLLSGIVSVVVALAGLAGVSGVASAQTDTGAAQGDRLVADAIWRTTILDLRLRHEPMARDYRLAGLMLDRAQHWAPSDSTLARERVEAWYQAGDLDRVIEVCKHMLRLDPGDTVAQLRLITTQIGRQQTVNDRLDVYARFLGPAGATLDPSVRSRLALDAALLYRERGDIVGFIEHLSMATGLDSTNKEAAALAESFYASKRTDPVGRLEMLCNLLYADPLDPSVHQSIALLLGRVGAYAEARRFYISAVAILYASGQSPPTSVGVDQLVLRWQSEGPASVVKELNTAILSQRDVSRRTIEQLNAQGIPSTGVTPPNELRLPIALEQVRLLAADAAGDVETRTSSAKDLAASVEKLVATVSAQGSAGLIGLDLAMDTAAVGISEFLVVTAISDEQNEQVRQSMRAFLARPDVDTVYREQLTPWVDLRADQVEAAKSKFQALGTDSSTLQLGLAMCEELLGNHDLAKQMLTEIAGAGRVTLLGAWARSRIMGPEFTWGDEESTEAEQCRTIAASVPRWVDEMIVEPRSFMSLTARAESTGGRNTVRLTLRNLSPLPLAVGSDRPINSRFLISPKIEVGIQSSNLDALPEVVVAERRLRLLQGEAVEIDVWPDLGYAGWLAETESLQTKRVRWGVLQGFQSGMEVTYMPGVLCLATQTGQVVLPPVASDQTREQLLEWFGSVGGEAGADTQDVHRAMMRLRAAAILPAERGGSDAETVKALATALAERYAALSTPSRIVLISGAPHTSQHPSMEALDRAIAGEKDPQALALAMLARATSDASELVVSARASGDAGLIAIADLLSERFAERDPTYGAVGPGLRPLAGPALDAFRPMGAPSPSSGRP